MRTNRNAMMTLANVELHSLSLPILCSGKISKLVANHHRKAKERGNKGICFRSNQQTN